MRAAKVEFGGLSLDITTLAKTGTSMPAALFVEPARLAGWTVARLGIITPHNPRLPAPEIELGPALAPPPLTTATRLGATEAEIIQVAPRYDGMLRHENRRARRALAQSGEGRKRGGAGA